MKRKFLSVSALILIIAFFVGVKAQASGFEGKMVFRDGQIDLMQVEVPRLAAVQSTPAFAKKAVAIPFDTYRQVIKEVGESGPGVKIHTSTIWVKGNLFRTDTKENGEKMAIIFDAKTQKMTTISWKEKKAMVVDVGKMMKAINNMAEQMGKALGMDANAMKQMMQGNQPPAENDLFTLKSTGKKKKINGFNCELYMGTDKEGNPLRVWLATPPATLKQAFDSIEEMTKAMEKVKEMQDKESKFYEKTNKMPILKKWVENNTDFNFEEFVSFKKQPVSQDLFKVPSGFKIVSMENMMQNQMMKMKQLQQQNRNR